MKPVETQIARNVLALREEVGLSQVELATRMRERGWKWSQATVWAVERGDRGLKLAEASDLADICERNLEELLREEKAFALVRQVEDLADKMDEMRKAIRTFETFRGSTNLMPVLEVLPDMDEWRALYEEVMNVRVRVTG